MIGTQRINSLAKQIRPNARLPVMLGFELDPRVPEYQPFPERRRGGAEVSIAWNAVRRLWDEQVEANIQAAHPDMDFRMMATSLSQDVARVWADRLKQSGGWDSAKYAREAAEAHQWALENGFDDHELDVPVDLPTVSGPDVTA